MTKALREHERLHAEAARIQMDRKVHSAVPKPGFIPVQMRQFRHVRAHNKILDLLGRAIELAPNIDYYRYLRAGVHLGARNFDAAQQDYEAVVAGCGEYSRHAQSGLVSLYLAMGDEAKASHALAELNAEQIQVGGVLKTLDDFDVPW